MPKLVCNVCDSESFDNIDGFYYCNVCGTKSQNICDIELSDEEVNHTGQQELNKATAKSKKKKEDDNDSANNIETNYSTFEVFNYLLKRQCEDLIRLGVDPVIKEVVLRLWTRYLKKLEIAFSNNENDNIQSKNIKWKRDKIYFELYHLDLKHTNENETDSNLKEENIGFNFSSSYNIDDNDENQKMIVDDIQSKEEDENQIKKEDDKEENDDNDDSDDEKKNSDQDSENNEDFLLQEELNSSKNLVSNNRKNILLIKFEWIRMPHTIALLNLALLIIKSQVLITDLIRFIYNGRVSYFNIDEVLPKYMEFTYLEDSKMFNMLSVPQADYLRYLTSKLGQYLEINEIELIQLNKITNRYVLDLNLPNELNSIVDLLIDKVNPIRVLNLEIAQYENLEAIALSYIYVALLVIFFYKSNNDDNDNDDDNVARYLLNTNKEKHFCLNEWINEMQNRLKNVKIEYFGCELENVRTVSDLRSLKLLNIKHRHKLRTKPYISQYRRKDIINTLKAPLENNNNKELNSIENDLNNKMSLFFITQLEKQNNNLLVDFSSKSIELYFDEEKLNLIGSNEFKSSLKFRLFLKETFELTHLRGRYALGLQSSTLDWILDIFTDISLTKSLFKFYDYVKKLLNKIK